MVDFEGHLRAIAAGVEPTAVQKQNAARSHNNLRSVLLSGRFGNRILHSYLSGSYSRDTAISPIDDVDVVFLIDPAGWPAEGFPFQTRPSPNAVLQSFAAAIRYRYPTSSVRSQRRSVRLEMYQRDIDVVPAIDAGNDVIWIPDGNADTWIKSAPLKQAHIGRAINSRRGGRFKPVVKILKYWNAQLPSTGRMKSFAVESIAIALFSHVGIPTLYEGVTRYFDFVSKFSGFFGSDTVYRWPSDYGVSLNGFSLCVPDASGVSDNVCRGLSAETAEKFVAHAKRSAELMVQANACRYVETGERLIEKALKVMGSRRG